MEELETEEYGGYGKWKTFAATGLFWRSWKIFHGKGLRYRTVQYRNLNTGRLKILFLKKKLLPDFLFGILVF